MYITADYARTLAHGGGPLWYPGAPRVEGFSSLKISRWPLSKRLPFGLFQNWVTLAYFVIAGVPFAMLGRRLLVPADRPLLLGLLAPVATVLYSTQNGGDFAWTGFGFDRHGAPALPLLAFTLIAVVLAARGTALKRALLAVSALLLGLGPVVTEMHGSFVRISGYLATVLDARRPLPSDGLSTWLIYDAKILGDVTRPGTRIAVCSAGAAVYFSRRGGVDILGKNDAYVAHLPASDHPGKDSRCLRSFAPSGHNKEDVPGTFALRRPEVSVVKPPAAAARQYVSFMAAGRRFYGRRRSRAIVWQRVQNVRPL